MGFLKDAADGLVAADSANRTRNARQGLAPNLIRFADKALLLLRSGSIDRENFATLAGLAKYNEDLLMDLYEMPVFSISPQMKEEQELRLLAQAAAAICTAMNVDDSDDAEDQEYGWSDFDAEVRGWLEGSRDGRALLLDTKNRGRYVQIRREEHRFLLETSNDKSNGGSAKLTMNEYNDLLEMRWKTPLSGAEYPNLWFVANFGPKGPSEAHYDAIRMILKRTLMEGFGVKDPGVLLDN